MSSSSKEIFEAFKPFIDMGVVGIFPDEATRKYSKVIYDKPSCLNNVMTIREQSEGPASRNMKEAIKNGCKTDKEIIEYCGKITAEKKKEAKETGKDIISDSIGPLLCQCPNEDCSLDMVYEIVTPKGEVLYERVHCY
jgi:hypothetical protein